MTECTVQDIPYEALPEAQRALLDPQRPLPEDTRFFADAFGETGVLIPCLLLWAILLWVLWSPLSETLAGRSSPDLWIEWASVWWHMTVAGLGLIVAVTLLVIWINHVLVRLRRGRHLGPGGDRRTGLFLGPDFLLFRRAEESLHEQVGGCTLIARSAIVGLERSNPRGNRNAKGWVLRVWYHSMEGALSRLDLCPEELSDGRWLEGVRSWAGDVPFEDHVTIPRWRTPEAPHRFANIAIPWPIVQPTARADVGDGPPKMGVDARELPPHLGALLDTSRALPEGVVWLRAAPRYRGPARERLRRGLFLLDDAILLRLPHALNGCSLLPRGSLVAISRIHWRLESGSLTGGIIITWYPPKIALVARDSTGKLRKLLFAQDELAQGAYETKGDDPGPWVLQLHAWAAARGLPFEDMVRRRAGEP